MERKSGVARQVPGGKLVSFIKGSRKNLSRPGSTAVAHRLAHQDHHPLETERVRWQPLSVASREWAVETQTTKNPYASGWRIGAESVFVGKRVIGWRWREIRSWGGV